MRGETGVPPGDEAGRTLDVLHVDDEAEFAAVTAEHLERRGDRLEVSTADSAEAGLARLESGEFDCVVSDYEMDGTDGLAFLDAVREAHGDLPFILFTGRGSEDIASRAISAGVTDYLQKGGGGDQYAVLANRIENAVDGARSRSALEASQQRLSLLVDQSPLGVIEWSTDFEVVALNPAAEEILGYEEAELRGRSWETIVPEGHREDVGAVVDRLLADEGGYRSVNENLRGDGERIICEWHNRAVTDGDGAVVGVFSQFQDVTEREESKRRLETLVSNLPGMVYRCRNEPDWPMEFVGGECESLTGYPASALEDGDVVWGEDVLHPEDRERAWRRVQTALDAGDPFEIEYRIRTADGDTRSVWERGRGVRDAGGDLVALEGFITDVTERVERERELSETNAVLSTLLENLPVGVLVEDSDREIVAVNAALTELLGVDRSPGALVGRDCREALEAVAPRFEDPGAFERRTEQLLVDREPVAAETFPLADGRVVERSYVPYSLPGGAASLWLYRDVTEREEREWKLEELQRRTRELMHTRTAEETATVAVRTAAEVVGAELSGVHLLDEDGRTLAPVATSDGVAEAFAEPPAYERDAHEGSVGAVVWEAFERREPLVVEDVGAHPVLEDGSPAESGVVHPLDGHGVFVVSATEPDAFDETDRALVEILGTSLTAALDRTERETVLRERERDLQAENERLDAFASIISHDLRNPLNVASGRLQLAREEHDSEDLAEVASALERMQSLVEDLLALSRQGTSIDEREPLEVATVARSALDTVETAAADVEIDADVTVTAHRSRLAQLFENLFRNAVEHGGEDVRVAVGALEDGFYVADDGPGVPDGERERVFEAGYSTRERGAGLGLSIVADVVEAHDWSVAVTESEAGGARFEVTTDD